MQEKAEFYEIAVRAGFYGVDVGGLAGKKDNVRKFWEDMAIKLALRPIVEEILQRQRTLRVVDLGCGSGEGYELLTHIPAHPHIDTLHRDFVLDADNIESYVGLDISPGMVEQGRANYRDRPNVSFAQTDLSTGYPLLSDRPPDLYFSSYGSLSHLTASELEHLLYQIFGHATEGSFVVFDMLGRFSPEWPDHWSGSAHAKQPYNMAYLLAPEERRPERIEWFQNSFWSAAELREVVDAAAQRAGRRVEWRALKDRSIFVGRHMDTGLFNGRAQPLRHQVNRLFDHGYRGQPQHLRVDAGWVEAYGATHPAVCAKLTDYAQRWNMVIDLVEALMARRDAVVKQLIESAEPALAEDLKMLAWLARNGMRFPVADYWASVAGPQIAVVLRNLEMNLPEALGCGHALFAVTEVRGAQ